MRTPAGAAMRINVEEHLSLDAVRIVMFRPPSLPIRSFEVGIMPQSPQEIAIRYRGKLIYSHTCNFVVDARLVLVEWKIQGMQMHINVRNPTQRRARYRSVAPVSRAPPLMAMMSAPDAQFGFGLPVAPSAEATANVAISALLSLSNAAQEARDAMKTEDTLAPSPSLPPPSHMAATHAATASSGLLSRGIADTLAMPPPSARGPVT